MKDTAGLLRVEKLVSLCRADWKYADLYLREAERAMAPLCTRQQFHELHLQALVGGDIHYGGADDLCSVGRAYDFEHITARFPVLRRDRFEAREPRVGA